MKSQILTTAMDVLFETVMKDDKMYKENRLYVVATKKKIFLSFHKNHEQLVDDMVSRNDGYMDLVFAILSKVTKSNKYVTKADALTRWKFNFVLSEFPEWHNPQITKARILISIAKMFSEETPYMMITDICDCTCNAYRNYLYTYVNGICNDVDNLLKNIKITDITRDMFNNDCPLRQLF